MVRLISCFRSPRPGKVMPSESQDGIYTIDMSSTSTIDLNNPREAESDRHRTDMQSRRHSAWWHILIDLPIFLLVASLCLLLELGVIPSKQFGFTCNDPALSLPYTGDTVSTTTLAISIIVAPFIVLWATEVAIYQEDEYTIKQNKYICCAKSAVVIYRDYIYGAVINLTLMEVLKCLVGSPRPTFFALCEPDTGKTCNGSEWVSSFKCTSTKYSRYLQIDSSRSFPSGHTSLSVYCGLFVAWYLQRRAFSWRNRSVLIVPLIQTLCVVSACVASFTRITDHRHHWWDVAVGAILGFSTLVYTTLILCKNFSQPSVVSTSDISSSDGNNHQSVRRLLSSGSHAVVA